MLELIIQIEKMDYGLVVEKVLPLLLEKLNREGHNPKLYAVLSKLKNMPGKAMARMLMLLPQTVKDEIAINILKMYEGDIVKKLNDYMSERQLAMEFSGISVEKAECMELKVRISHIDYSSVLLKAYPMLLEKFKDDGKYKNLFRLISAVGGYSEKLIFVALEALTQDERDNLVISILGVYEEDVLRYIGEWVAESGMKIKITGMEVRKTPSGEPPAEEDDTGKV